MLRTSDMKVRVYSEIPPSTSSTGSDVGSNPKIYEHIKQELLANSENIAEVHLALYLFNNKDLYTVLKRLAERSNVTVISLPLAGYDSRKVMTARAIYADIAKGGTENFNLLIYPHMYVWYGAEYAEGAASYSFHVKAGYVTYKDGSCKLILTSCNMAPGDPYHSEIAIIIEDDSCCTPYSEAFRMFFNEVEKRSYPWSQYQTKTADLPADLQRAFDFVFIGKHRLTDWTDNFVDHAFFTGPFIKIKGMGSTHYARKKIVEIIKNAERRVLVCAQHVHDLAPFNGYSGSTLISAIIEKKRENPNIDVKVLKQVSSSGLADKRRAAFVECHLNYAGVEQRVNKLVHDKFIIADDTVIITTSNFTATQFGWGERRMEYTVKKKYNQVNQVVNSALSFFNHPVHLVSVRPVRSRRTTEPKTKIVKQDVFAEINGFVIIEEQSLADKLADHFNKLWNHRLSEAIKIPR